MTTQKFTIINKDQFQTVDRSIKLFQHQYVYRSLESKLASRLLHDILELADTSIDVTTPLDVTNLHKLKTTVQGVIDIAYVEGGSPLTESDLEWIKQTNKELKEERQGFVGTEEVVEVNEALEGKAEENTQPEETQEEEVKTEESNNETEEVVEIIEDHEGIKPVVIEDNGDEEKHPEDLGDSPEETQEEEVKTEELVEITDGDDEIQPEELGDTKEEEVKTEESNNETEEISEIEEVQQETQTDTKVVENTAKPQRKGKKSDTSTDDFESLDVAAKDAE